MKEIGWSEDDIQKVLAMKVQGRATEHIAEAMGKTPKAIYQMLYRRRRGDVRKRALFVWTAHDVAELKRLSELGHSSREIAAMMGRTHAAVMTKRGVIKRQESADIAVPLRPAHRHDPVPQYTDLTAAFFGDPLPGRSALDRRNAA